MSQHTDEPNTTSVRVASSTVKNDSLIVIVITPGLDRKQLDYLQLRVQNYLEGFINLPEDDES